VHGVEIRRSFPVRFACRLLATFDLRAVLRFRFQIGSLQLTKHLDDDEIEEAQDTSRWCYDSSMLRSIHAVFSCTCMRCVSKSQVGWSFAPSAVRKISRAVRATVS